LSTLTDIHASEIHGNGLFAAQIIVPTAVIAPLFFLRHPINGFPAWPRDIEILPECWNLNHRKEANCTVASDGRKWFLVAGSAPIEQGDELTINYAHLPHFMDRRTTGFAD